MFQMEDFKPVRFVYVKLVVFVFFIWLVFILCSKGLSSSPPSLPALIHEGPYIVIPETSPYRKVISIEADLKTPFSVPLIVPAVVNADPALVLNVYAPLVGRLIEFKKELGDYVKAGDVLFTMHSADFAQVQSELLRAKSAFLLASHTLERQKKLAQAFIASQGEVQAAQNNYDQTHSELIRTEQQLKAIQSIANSKDTQSLVVHAAASGYITDIYASSGAYWTDLTRPILTITDISHVFVMGSIQEKDIDAFYVGQPIQLMFDAYSEPVEAKIDWINPLLNPDTRTLEINVTLDNSDNIKYKPNMFAQGIIQGRLHDAVILPVTAVLQRGFDSIVFVEVAPWRFESRSVKTGFILKDKIEVLSGLSGHERVVTHGGILLND